MDIYTERDRLKSTNAILDEIQRMQSQTIERLEKRIAQLEGSSNKPKKKKKIISHLKLMHGGKE